MSFYEDYDRLQQYPPCIRLLTILPPDPKRKHQIVAELKQVALADKPNYTAISYTWSRSPPSKNYVEINKIRKYLTERVRSILSLARKPKESMFLWIDTICINQSSEEEKNYQVPLMGMIYGQAAQTMIYLGSSAKASSDALQFIHRFKRDSGLTPPEQKEHAVTNLLNRPYWGRAWIRPEILNSSNILLYCGERNVAWADFIYCLHSPLLKRIADGTKALNLLRYTGSEANRTLQTLQQLIEKYGKSECSDSRDRVHALLPLASDCKDKPDALKPDYKGSIHDFCERIITFCHPTDLNNFRATLSEVLGIDPIPMTERTKEYVKSKSQQDFHKSGHFLTTFSISGILEAAEYPEPDVAGRVFRLRIVDRAGSFSLASVFEKEGSVSLTSSEAPEPYVEDFLYRSDDGGFGILLRQATEHHLAVGLVLTDKPLSTGGAWTPRITSVAVSKHICWLAKDNLLIPRGNEGIKFYISAYKMAEFVGHLQPDVETNLRSKLGPDSMDSWARLEAYLQRQQQQKQQQQQRPETWNTLASGQPVIDSSYVNPAKLEALLLPPKNEMPKQRIGRIPHKVPKRSLHR